MAFAQDPCGSFVLNGYSRKPTPYRAVREADVSWSKRIWRDIDAHEKINRIFRYSQEKKPDPNFINLIDLLLCNIMNQTLMAYDASVDDHFTKELSREEVQWKISGHWDIHKVEIPEPPYEKEVHKLIGSLKKEDVVLYRIKEDWFFDKKWGKMDVRIIGICPVCQKRDDYGNLKEGYEPLFWIYFPEARYIFANADVYNSRDTAKRVTWDDVFNERMFGSYIIKESNVRNESIDQTKVGMDQIIESKRIHDNRVNQESDMWEY